MQKWEYAIFGWVWSDIVSRGQVTFSHNVETWVNESELSLGTLRRLGDEGWELVTVHGDTSRLSGFRSLYFKRAIPG